MEFTMTKIPLEEVCYYLNIPFSKMDETLKQTIEAMIDTLYKQAQPRFIYREYAYREGQLVDSCFPLVGNDIHHLLATSEQCILIAATLGVAVDTLIKKMQIQDMAKAVILDACANAGLEAALDLWQERLRKEKEEQGWYLTERFSPGYGDMPMDVQPLFLQELQTQKRIGLHITSSNLLVPGKSVTAILGLSKELQPAILSGCAVCALKETCQKRKDGNPCVRK